jgi:hypothetical protein
MVADEHLLTFVWAILAAKELGLSPNRNEGLYLHIGVLLDGKCVLYSRGDLNNKAYDIRMAIVKFFLEKQQREIKSKRPCKKSKKADDSHHAAESLSVDTNEILMEMSVFFDTADTQINTVVLPAAWEVLEESVSFSMDMELDLDEGAIDALLQNTATLLSSTALDESEAAASLPSNMANDPVDEHVHHSNQVIHQVEPMDTPNPALGTTEAIDDLFFGNIMTDEENALDHHIFQWNNLDYFDSNLFEQTLTKLSTQL